MFSQLYRSFLKILLKSLRFVSTQQTFASSLSGKGKFSLGAITKVTYLEIPYNVITLAQFP